MEWGERLIACRFLAVFFLVGIAIHSGTVVTRHPFFFSPIRCLHRVFAESGMPFRSGKRPKLPCALCCPCFVGFVPSDEIVAADSPPIPPTRNPPAYFMARPTWKNDLRGLRLVLSVRDRQDIRLGDALLVPLPRHGRRYAPETRVCGVV